MTPQRFQLVEDLFHSTLEQEPQERLGYLAQACGGDRELLLQVQSLIGAEPGRLHDLVASTAALKLVDTLVGRRVGAYSIESELGSGGMGDVYLAIRADESYRKKVAIKLVKAGWLSSIIQERFRAERQILANLDHPYIARLLDGGTMPDGRPYLVMEYVDGFSIIEFADRHHLSLVQRVELFCRICEAVQYAHQNLIVHRDLKPSNIVITHEGTPKLLDFGIAKLLDPQAGGSETQPHGWRMLTPDYASPEQFRGDAVTTATDVYSLGAILYLLLTGQQAFAVSGKTPAETERIVSEQEPERPSLRNPTLRGRLGRDLDTVVLKTLRKNPLERYGSVSGLAADLEHAVAGLPLKACNYTVWERGVRLMRRHRVGVAAGAIVAASLLASTVVSIGFASRAERERVRAEEERSLANLAAQRAIHQQARAETNEKEAKLRQREADRQRQRADASLALAERRHRDEHALAAEVLFGINDSLRNLPGATAVRAQAISKSSEFLDRLAQDSRGNIVVQQDLARSYSRLAELTGDPSAANQGNLAGALALNERAAGILTQLLALKPRDRTLRQQLAASHSDRIRVLAYLGRGREAEEEGNRAIEIFTSLTNEFPRSESVLGDLARIYVRMAISSSLFPDRTRAIHYAAVGRQAYERLVALNPHALESRIGLADALSQEASAKLFLGDTGSALTASLEALRIREQLRVEAPGDRRILEALMFSYGRLGDITKVDPGGQGIDYRRSLDYYRQARDIAALLASKDPANQRAQLDLAIASSRLGEGYSNLGEDENAIKVLRESGTVLETLMTSDRGNKVTQTYQLVNYPRLGFHLMRLNQRAPALAAYQRALQISEAIIDAGDRSDTPTLAYTTAKVGLALDAVHGNEQNARKWSAQAATVAQQHAIRQQSTIASKLRSYANVARVGQVYELLSSQGPLNERHTDQERALDYYRKANEGWAQLPEAARLRANKFDLEAMAHSREASVRLSGAGQVP